MITNVDFQKTTEDAFLKYAASVAQERAIPDVRDMLKIGLRQGLYAQYTNNLTHKDKFQKAQKSVAAAMTQSYVHGDVAMYDTLIRVARPWTAHKFKVAMEIHLLLILTPRRVMLKCVLPNSLIICFLDSKRMPLQNGIGIMMIQNRFHQYSPRLDIGIS